MMRHRLLLYSAQIRPVPLTVLRNLRMDDACPQGPLLA